MKKAFLNWSSGKDSALALSLLFSSEDVSVELLFTTLDKEKQLVSMHGIPENLLDAQAESLEIPLKKIHLPTEFSADSYAKIMKKELTVLKNEGFQYSCFGDIFLEDLKAYREKQLSQIGLEALFPLWKMDTGEIMQEFIRKGFKAVCVCVNLKYLDESFCGREIDQHFLDALPKNVDHCGENGEFHTFVYDGPIFKKSIAFERGEVYQKNYPSPDEKWDAEFAYLELKK